MTSQSPISSIDEHGTMWASWNGAPVSAFVSASANTFFAAPTAGPAMSSISLANASVSNSAPSPVSAPIASTVASPERELADRVEAVARVQHELAFARRVLEIQESAQRSTAFRGYAERLAGVLKGMNAIKSIDPRSKSMWLELSTAQISLALARDWLLSNETNYRAWVGFARVLFPTGLITVPQRFVESPPTRREEPPISARAIRLARAWVGDR